MEGSWFVAVVYTRNLYKSKQHIQYQNFWTEKSLKYVVWLLANSCGNWQLDFYEPWFETSQMRIGVAWAADNGSCTKITSYLKLIRKTTLIKIFHLIRKTHSTDWCIRIARNVAVFQEENRCYASKSIFCLPVQPPSFLQHHWWQAQTPLCPCFAKRQSPK